MKGNIMNITKQSQPDTPTNPNAGFPPAPPRASTEQPFKSKGKGVRRSSSPKQAEIHADALQNALNNKSTMNYETIINGFVKMGIPLNEIFPRENVFTFKAWKALGRIVKKGQHGVKVLTFVKCEKIDEKTGNVSTYTRTWTTTVFHVSQTEEI
jgi:antirestriction protein ArdC